MYAEVEKDPYDTYVVVREPADDCAVACYVVESGGHLRLINGSSVYRELAQSAYDKEEVRHAR